jgi:hypothetical protein
MRISAAIMPFFAIIAGAAGFYLRLMELWNVFDMRTGLPERGAPITIALIIVSAVFLILILLFAIRASMKRRSPGGFENAFGTESLAYPLVFSLIGIVWIGATVKHIVDLGAMGALPMAELYFSILSVLSAISIAFFAIEIYQDPRRKLTLVLSVIPTLFMCYWLILVYRQHASNPILLSYCYQCLAIILSTLGFYYTSGFVYSKPAPGKTIFIYLAAIYFCFVTLADEHTISIRLIFVAIIAMNVLYSSKLIRNLQKKTG